MNTRDPFGFSKFPILEIKRLILREPILSDAADIFVFRSDSIVQRYNSKPMAEISEAKEFIKQLRTGYNNQEWVHWAVTLKEQDTVIDLVGFGE